ncbi:MAG: hypothetical protein WA584_01930 [Pyrinomonadaceae bacterium]
MSNSEMTSQECAEFFCKTVAELNSITLKQMEGLLNLAVTAAEKINSPGKTDDGTEVVSELKSMAEEVSQNAFNQEEAISEDMRSKIPVNENAVFCNEVEHTLSNAMANFADNQQRLNIIGSSILTQAATLILSSEPKSN